MTRRSVEIHSLTELDSHLASTMSLDSSAAALDGWFVQSVDLAERGDVLRRVDPRGAVFLGCSMPPALEASLRSRGALLFPSLPDLPFDPYRPALYDAVELYSGAVSPRSEPKPEDAVDPPQTRPRYAASRDAAIYAWSKSSAATRTLAQTLAATLHDHAITDALDDATGALSPGRVTGVMGGHALQRGDEGYRKAADLGALLTRGGRMVLTGGGPGAMEAANLGAYLSPWSDPLEEALGLLSRCPSYRRGGVDDWADAAFAVRDRWPLAKAGHSLSIPTWFYGHEPTNVFATGIAKYFANALREDTLLHRCRGGIVYLPGQAGTVQEVFQAVTENFYAADRSLIAPLVLVGVDYWYTTLPVWPLLQRLSGKRPMASSIFCVDTVGEAADMVMFSAEP